MSIKMLFNFYQSNAISKNNKVVKFVIADINCAFKYSKIIVFFRDCDNLHDILSQENIN